jgi:SAM-dependent methyltransferase
MLTPADWHQRFMQQSRWTAQVRRFLFDGLNLSQAVRGLEVGCGTGVIAADLAKTGPVHMFGIDLRADFLHLAQQKSPELRLARTDALRLPFSTASFDLTCCHYFLLWVRDPLAALKEMRRVTRPGAPVLAMAEPDYGGRIDYPNVLAEIGQKQSDALRDQGAEPEIGRRLVDLFQSAGLHNPQAAVMGGQWGERRSAEMIASEWAVLEADLSGRNTLSELAEYKKEDALAWQNGVRFLYVPTFYAWGFA